MFLFLMRCLILSSCILAIFGCASSYRHLQQATGNIAGIEKFKPNFTSILYAANIEVVGHHLSGMLLIKKMPDSSIRIVFSNEMGFTFFDFEFGANGNFKIYSIIKKLNKKAVIKTLRKDFELILMQSFNFSAGSLKKSGGELYHVFPQKKGFNYYITDSLGTKLLCMERASKRAPVTIATMENYVAGVPDTIGIRHTKFDFTIGLKRIIRE